MSRRRAPELLASMLADAAWFERHIGRRHHLRPPIGPEVETLRIRGPADALPLIVTQKRAEGLISVGCYVDWIPLDTEEMAATLWQQASAGNRSVAAIEAELRRERRP